MASFQNKGNLYKLEIELEINFFFKIKKERIRKEDIGILVSAPNGKFDIEKSTH